MVQDVAAAHVDRCPCPHANLRKYFLTTKIMMFGVLRFLSPACQEAAKTHDCAVRSTCTPAMHELLGPSLLGMIQEQARPSATLVTWFLAGLQPRRVAAGLTGEGG